MSFGNAVLGALFGGRGSAIGKGVTAARGVGRASQQAEDVDRAESGLAALRKQAADLRAEIETEVAAVQAAWDDSVLAVDTVTVAPRKSDLAVERLALCWAPWRIAPSGTSSPAW
jgi:hypothetical protein